MDRALRALLVAAFPALTEARINLGENPQGGARPYIVIHLISRVERHTMQGPDGVEQYRVQIEAHAPHYGAAVELGNQIKDVLDFYRAGRFLGILHDVTRMRRADGGEAGDQTWFASSEYFINWRARNG